MIHACLRGACIALVGFALAIVAADVRGDNPGRITPEMALKIVQDGLPESHPGFFGAGSDPAWAPEDGGFNWSCYRIDADGLTMSVLGETFEYEFASVQHGTVTLPATPSVSPALNGSGHIVLDRGPVVERYEIRDGAVEQFFVVSQLPGSGDLVVRGTTAGLAFDAARSNEQFLSYGSVTVTKAVAIDAAGSQQPLALAHEDGFLKITVPEAWLTSAVLPITIDPFFFPATPIHQPTVSTDAQLPRVLDVCYNDTNDEYFVVYHFQPNTTGLGGECDVFGRRISAVSGLPIGNVIDIEVGAFVDARVPSVAWNSVNNTYLVVYSDAPWPVAAASRQHIRGRILNANGQSLSPQKFDISFQAIQNFGEYDPSVAWDGAGFCVVWSREGVAANLNGQFNVFFQRISGGGGYIFNQLQAAPVNGQTIENGVADARRPHIEYLGGAANTYMVVWSQAVVPLPTVPGQFGNILLTTINPATSLPGGQFQVSSDNTLDHDNPRIATNLTNQDAMVVWDSGPTRQNNPFGFAAGGQGSTQINYRRVNAQGIAQGAAQQNLVTGGINVTIPDIAWTNVDNQYVVVWSDGNGAAVDTAVRAAVLAADGAVVTPNILGAQVAAQDQHGAAIAARLDNPHFIVAWDRIVNQAGGLNISFWERFFATSGPLPGGSAGGEDRGNDNGNQGINDMFCGAATAGSWVALLLLGSALLILTRKSS